VATPTALANNVVDLHGFRFYLCLLTLAISQQNVISCDLGIMNLSVILTQISSFIRNNLRLYQTYSLRAENVCPGEPKGQLDVTVWITCQYNTPHVLYFTLNSY
jgi:hypothetical protein